MISVGGSVIGWGIILGSTEYSLPFIDEISTEIFSMRTLRPSWETHDDCHRFIHNDNSIEDCNHAFHAIGYMS